MEVKLTEPDIDSRQKQKDELGCIIRVLINEYKKMPLLLK
jgi:hypothetical protein